MADGWRYESILKAPVLRSEAVPALPPTQCDFADFGVRLPLLVTHLKVPTRAMAHVWCLLMMSGWRNTAEIVLFEISNSLKPYPSFFRAYIGKSRPVIGFSEQKKLIEVSNRIPPTSQIEVQWSERGSVSPRAIRARHVAQR